jgi:hypothetical protein
VLLWFAHDTVRISRSPFAVDVGTLSRYDAPLLVLLVVADWNARAGEPGAEFSRSNSDIDF